MRANLVLIENEDGSKELYVTDHSTSCPEICKPDKLYRISPIFPVLPERAVLPNLDDQVYVGLFTSESSFELQGTIISDEDSGIQSSLWFNHGLASTILFAPDQHSIKALYDKYHMHIQALELWEINKHHLHVVQTVFSDPASIITECYSIGEIGSFDQDISSLANDIQHNIYRLVDFARHHVPSLLPVCKLFSEEIAGIIADTSLLLDPSIATEEETAQLRSLMTDSTARQKRIFLLTDYLAQASSALSKCYAQLAGCSTPITNGHCVYHSYSLFGVGSATLALMRFGCCVDRVFEKYPVCDVIRDIYPTLPGVDVFSDLRVFDPAVWDVPYGQVDTYLATVTAPIRKARILRLSRLLGFQEALFCVSAPMQILAGADSARWSLMTLSHELMHAHVREMLGAIFDSDEISEISFQRIHTRFRNYRTGRLSDPRKWTLQESLQFAVLNYCVFRKSIDLMTARLDARKVNSNRQRRKVHTDSAIPPLSEMREDFAQYYKFINEIFTHVLDYHYFYYDQQEQYLRLVWQSWSTVPSVLEDIGQYILRSIITIGSAEKGDTDVRFDKAVRALEDCVNWLLAKDSDNALLNRVIEFLGDPRRMKLLRLHFAPGYYLAQVVSKFMLSRKIHTALSLDDPNAIIADDGFNYELDTYDFQGFPVISTVAFIADRLRRSLSTPEGVIDDIVANSAWVLLASASCAKEVTANV